MYTFIVNPNARSGLGKAVWTDLEKKLKERNIAYEVFFTKYQKHATEITRQITSDGDEHIVVALGGDGTVNETVNGIVNLGKTIFGYIPIGSSNDFARGHKLPTDPMEALNSILEMKRLHPINVGELRYKNKVRRFAVSCGFGFDADICHEVVVSRVKKFLNKLGLGKLTYVFVAVHRLFVTTPCTVKIIMDDGEERVFPRTYFVATMNSKYEGGGAKFCPKAKADDDKIDLCIVNGVPKIYALMLFPAAFMGIHTLSKATKIFTCKKATMIAEKPLPVHTDGEPIFIQKEITVSCLPEKIRLIQK